MTTLKETLPVLDAAVPQVPVKVATAAREGEAFRHAVEELLADIEQRRTTAAEMLGRVEASLSALKEQAAERQQQVERRLEPVEGALEEALTGLDEGQGALSEALHAVAGEMDTLRAHLGDGGQRAQVAQEESDRALDELRGGIQESGGELEFSLKAACATVQGVGGELEKAQGTLTQAIEQLNEKMAEVVAQARGRLDETLGRLKGMQAGLEAGVGEALGELASHNEQLVEEVRARMQTEVKERLRTGLAVVEDCLAGMGEATTQATQVCRGDQEQLQQQFEALRGRVPPLQKAVLCVKQAAEQVGISW